MRYVFALAAIMLGVMAGILPAEARRVALAIGNAEYKVGRLANPVNDAAAVAATLEKQLRFDKVLLRANLTLDGFRAALREMAAQARGAELGVVFFAGHGIEVGGRNYLIPTDAGLAASADIDLEAIALDTVLRQLEGVTRLRLVILDACRNSPFPAATRSVRGLSRIEPDLGTLVAYAAKDGTLAEDGKGRHSPFTAALLKRVVTPGLDVRRLFGYVSEDVMAATGRRQEPYLYGRLGGDEVYLNPRAPARPEAGEVERDWAAVKDATSVAMLEAFIARHKGTFHASLARARIEELKRIAEPKQVAVAVPKPGPAPKAVEPAVAVTPGPDLTPGRTFRDCPECPEMVVVPAGSFTMGAPASEAERTAEEGPQRRVIIARPFAVGKYEVTFAEWDACVAAGGCKDRPSDEGWGRDRRPVINVWWDGITREYLPWLSRKTGTTYRLLSEAEWEYAARAGATTRYHFGDGERDLCTYGNVADQTGKEKDAVWTVADCRDGHVNTAPVGSFRPNAFGLHDMHGNVWELVQDCWHKTYRGAPSDGSAWTTGECGRRILRGGSWFDYPQRFRLAARNWLPTGLRLNYVGFRVARTL